MQSEEIFQTIITEYHSVNWTKEKCKQINHLRRVKIFFHSPSSVPSKLNLWSEKFSLNFPHSHEALVNALQKKNNGKEKQKKGGIEWNLAILPSAQAWTLKADIYH